MKIVVDVDENVYTRLFDNGIEGYSIITDDIYKLAIALRKGTPFYKVIDEIKAKIDFEEKWLMDVWHTDEKTNRRMRIDDIKVAMDGLRHFINEKVKEHKT